MAHNYSIDEKKDAFLVVQLYPSRDSSEYGYLKIEDQNWYFLSGKWGYHSGDGWWNEDKTFCIGFGRNIPYAETKIKDFKPKITHHLGVRGHPYYHHHVIVKIPSKEWLEAFFLAVEELNNDMGVRGYITLKPMSKIPIVAVVDTYHQRYKKTKTENPTERFIAKESKE